MKVAVGTNNPLKLKVVEEVFKKAFSDVRVFGIKCDSGVPDEPQEEQLLQGALNRAKGALNAVEAGDPVDFGVGIEAGIIKIGGKICETGLCVIVDKSGRHSIGSQPMFELPPAFAERALKGEELGNITDDFFKLKNTKHSVGAAGMLSKGLITREDLLKAAVKTALMPWISRDIYEQ